MSVFLDSTLLYMLFCLIERVCGELGKIESKKMQRASAAERLSCRSAAFLYFAADERSSGDFIPLQEEKT